MRACSAIALLLILSQLAESAMLRAQGPTLIRDVTPQDSAAASNFAPTLFADIAPPVLINELTSPGIDSTTETAPSQWQVLPDDSSAIESPIDTVRRRVKRGRAPNGERPPFNWSAGWTPQQRLTNQAGEIGWATTAIALGYPLSIAPSGITLLTGRVQYTEFQTDALLPDLGRAFPAELWNIELGLMRIQELDNDRRLGGFINIGSPSDEPFASLREMTVTTMVFYNLPANENDEWSFSLFYSPTGQLAFPVPGVAYVWRPSEQFEMQIGIPFSLRYQPNEAVTWTVSYLPLTNFQARYERVLSPTWTMYADYRIVNDIYQLADRSEDEDRFNLFDQRVTLGFRRSLPRGWRVDLSAAYLFDRQVFSGPGFADDRSDQLDIADGVWGQLQFSWVR